MGGRYPEGVDDFLETHQGETVQFFAEAFGGIAGESFKANLRCPACHHRGTFEYLSAHDLMVGYEDLDLTIGARRCPNPECHAIVIAYWDRQANRLVHSYPPERIDFDATSLPENVLSTLQEAITCHANQCHRAAAMMLRRTLEELCDERAAIGKDLRTRIESLRQGTTLPPELIDALDQLRLLGNDAAHAELKSFDNVGDEEVSLAVALVKEILKTVYQMAALVDRMKALKKT